MSGACCDSHTIHAYGRAAAARAAPSSPGSRGSTARHAGSRASASPGVASTMSGQWLARPAPQATAAHRRAQRRRRGSRAASSTSA